jgi:putative transposase
MFKKHVPPRLSTIFQDYAPPLYFVTFCTWNRVPWLAAAEVHQALIAYAEIGNQTSRAAVGRYVIMPDHVHLFVRLAPEERLGRWVSGLKRGLSVVATEEPGHGQWQSGFFDHVLRHTESYAEKWRYVRENPVRKGMVQAADEWPYQGEIVIIRDV